MILNELQRFFADDRDDYETRLFARGQLARLATLNDVAHSALHPDTVAEDDVPTLRKKLNGVRF